MFLKDSSIIRITLNIFHLPYCLQKHVRFLFLYIVNLVVEMLCRVLCAIRFAIRSPSMVPRSLQSKSRLQSMTHEELLAYALHHACSDRKPSGNSAPSPSLSLSSPQAAGTKRQHASPSHDPEIGYLDGVENHCNFGSTEEDRNDDDEQKANSSKKGGEISPRKKPRRQFDMSRYGQRMIALKFNYQGWRFHGLASQSTSGRSVEDYIFAALLRTRLIVSRDSCFYSRAGRTDVGVSAAGQVIGLQVRSGLVPPSKSERELDYVKMLNSCLPDGIRVTAWSPVCDGNSALSVVYPGDTPAIRKHWTQIEAAAGGSTLPENSKGVVRRPGERFSARFDALSRSYRYFFARGGLDLSAMAEAAAMFIGRHDFRNFCRIDENIDNFERVMYDVEIRRARDDKRVQACEELMEDVNNEYEMYYIFVRGQAFLWHQVRCMSAVLFDIGLRRETPDVVRDMLNDASSGLGDFSQGRPQYRIASPTPLVFWECEFPESVVWFGGGVNGMDENEETVQPMRSVVRADAHISECWAEAAAKREILGTMLSNRSPRERILLIGSYVGRHVPYRIRARDPPLWKRRKRTADGIK